MSNINEPWQIAAARFCVEHSEKGFEFKELKDFINANYKVRDRHLEFFVQEEIQHPTGRQFSRQGDNGNWVPPLSLVSMVTDYDELKEARKNAKNAFYFSIIAIVISLLTLFK
jgi:hypothetical protein